jgi:hypothetical protein
MFGAGSRLIWVKGRLLRSATMRTGNDQPIEWLPFLKNGGAP